jgi:hypothetical protein
MKIFWLILLFSIEVFSIECDTTNFKIVSEYSGLLYFKEGHFFVAEGAFVFDAGLPQKIFYKKDSSCFEVTGIDRKSLKIFGISKGRKNKEMYQHREMCMEMARILNHEYSSHVRRSEQYLLFSFFSEKDVRNCVFLKRRSQFESNNDGNLGEEFKYSCISFGIDDQINLVDSANCASLFSSSSKKMIRIKSE